MKGQLLSILHCLLFLQTVRQKIYPSKSSLYQCGQFVLVCQEISRFWNGMTQIPKTLSVLASREGCSSSPQLNCSEDFIRVFLKSAVSQEISSCSFSDGRCICFPSLSLVSYQEDGERNAFGQLITFNSKPETVFLIQFPEWDIILFHGLIF